MEHIDLKAAHEEHIVDVGVGVGIGVCAKHNQRRRGIFGVWREKVDKWTRCHHRERKKTQTGVD